MSLPSTTISMEKHARKTLSLYTTSVLYFVVFLYSTSVEGHASFTIKEKFLFGYQIQENFQTDWIGCLMKCQEHSECVSYNYHTRKNFCQLNHHGIEHACMAEDVLHSGSPYIFQQVKPVTNGRLASRRILQKCSCNCGADNQCTSNNEPGVGDTPELAAQSCKDILQRRSDATDGPYYLDAFPNKTFTYCHMTEIPGCGGGGWTLVIKMDGNKQTFKYNSTLWESMAPYKSHNGVDLKEKETLLPTYWYTKFTRLCLGMKHDGNTSWIAINYTADSLLSVFRSPGRKVETHLDVSQWKSLLRGSSLQTACTVQGFNILHKAPETASARIGITGFPGNCTTSASRIGFGTGGTFYGMDGTNTCGNEAKNKPDNGERSIKAFGYIFIQ
ncbi:uncharacterized protein LOC116291635 [Actinia tenebrosa]|uniref:Uncharacterized protein LOC116291635 n=1 Tax=Actinia tenebrosa TaxID=6105 RepID=A0A6P8HFU1_ACTTE|nr:uncharacterized protein LOC116291635 [Actinia tenebrosa]